MCKSASPTVLHLYDDAGCDEILLVDGDYRDIERAIDEFKAMVHKAYVEKRENKPIKLKNGHKFLPEMYSVDDFVNYLECKGLKVVECYYVSYYF